MADEQDTVTEETEAEESEAVEPAYDIETYRHAIEEARRTLDQQLNAFNDVGEKAWRIVQLNGIVATIYISAIANALGSLQFTTLATGFIGGGLCALGLSAYLVVNGQDAQVVFIGQSTHSFAQVRKYDPPEIAYLYKTLESYECWIESVGEKTEQNGTAVNNGKYAFLIGVALITIGTVLAVV